MAKSRLVGHAAPFFTTLALARPAWAHGVPQVWLDDVMPRLFYLCFLSFACYVGYALIVQHERRRRWLSYEEPERPRHPKVEQELLMATLLIAIFVAVPAIALGILPAPFFPTVPFGYALVRRRSWLGVAVLLTALLICVPPCLALLLDLLSV